MIMKTIFFLSVAILFLFLVVSCKDSATESDTESDSSKTYTVADFSSLDLEIIGTVRYEQADSAYLNVSGSSTLIKALKVSESKGKLSIDLKNKRKYSGDKKELIIKVGSPRIQEISFNSIGTLHLVNYLESEELTITNKGVGKIKIDDCHVGSFNLTTRSLGPIEIKGTSNRTYINSEGMGKIDCSEFKSKKAEVVSKGIGNLSVYAKESVNISMTGMGNVTYYGDPAEVKTDISGLGKVIRMAP